MKVFHGISCLSLQATYILSLDEFLKKAGRLSLMVVEVEVVVVVVEEELRVYREMQIKIDREKTADLKGHSMRKERLEKWSIMTFDGTHTCTVK